MELGYLDKLASLMPNNERIICGKNTERPHTGLYNKVIGQGTFLCKRCGLALFRGQYQFHSGSGWPSFDESIKDAVKQIPDADGSRTEIVCSRCKAHLGHVFRDEYFTDKNCRHCVNAAALDWVADDHILDSEEAIVAGGCFWGVEYYLNQLPGVVRVESGYIGGHGDNPSYNQVCAGDSGYLEAVRVIYDPAKTHYSAVIKRFFEIHDSTQAAGQGPDIGTQYQSGIFYYNQLQQNAAQRLIQQLESRGYNVATQLRPMSIFWPAEEYHQQYYKKHEKTPYCHRLVMRFG